jgi:hypothetical protein
VTQNEAIARAKVIANDQRWPWHDPAYVARRRRGLLGLFVPYWEVISNARANGENVRVAFEERTGRMFQSRFVPAGIGGPAITEFRALEIAREVAERSGWRWEEPILVTPSRNRRDGVRPWWIWSKADCRGQNVSVLVHPDTGEVLSAGVTPR